MYQPPKEEKIETPATKSDMSLSVVKMGEDEMILEDELFSVELEDINLENEMFDEDLTKQQQQLADTNKDLATPEDTTPEGHDYLEASSMANYAKTAAEQGSVGARPRAVNRKMKNVKSILTNGLLLLAAPVSDARMSRG